MFDRRKSYIIWRKSYNILKLIKWEYIIKLKYTLGGNIIMKKLKENFRMVSIISHMALGFSVIAANTLCCAIYHQPAKPDLKKLRKF